MYQENNNSVTLLNLEKLGRGSWRFVLKICVEGIKIVLDYMKEVMKMQKVVGIESDMVGVCVL